MLKPTTGLPEVCGGSNQIDCSTYSRQFQGSGKDDRILYDIAPGTERGRSGTTTSRLTSIADSSTVKISNRHTSSIEESLNRQKSRSMPPGIPSSTSSDLDNNALRLNQDRDFILPQYIGNMYAKNKNGSGSPLRSSFLAQGDTSSYLLCLKRHISCVPHGIGWTALAIVISWGGLGLAFLARQSLSFVRLEEPWRIAAIYEGVFYVGVIGVTICYNETVSTIEDPTRIGCFNVPLATNDDLDDPIIKLTAVFASVSVMVGLILTLAMTTAVFWRTINLRAVGTGYLLTFCFQSLSFLFFETDICKDSMCKVDIGCGYCIAASLFWVFACILCAKMDSNIIQLNLTEECYRKKEAAAKEFVRKQSIIIHRSGATVITERTTSTTSDEPSLEMDEESAMTGSRESSELENSSHSTEELGFDPSFSKDFISSSDKRLEKTQRKMERRHESIFVRSPPRRLAVGHWGLELQHANSITLDPGVESGRYSTGNIAISPLTLTTTQDTLSNFNHGRVEFNGKVLPMRRGRSRSKRRSWSGQEDFPRSSSNAVTRLKSHSRTRRHQSVSDTSRYRAENNDIPHHCSRITPRLGSSLATPGVCSGSTLGCTTPNSVYARKMTWHEKEPAEAISFTMPGAARDSRTQVIKIPTKSSHDALSPMKIQFVTSYFDI